MSIRFHSWFQTLCRLWQRPRPATKPKSAAHHAGQWGEKKAEKFLREKGYRILERRARPSRRGELDLVATDGRTLVFVEVKTRNTEAFGSPASAVNHAKRHALNKAAVRYLQHAGWPRRVYRIDIIEVIGAPEAKTRPVIRHHENAVPFERRLLTPL